MAINFPDSPSVDEIYSVGNKSWLWNGTYWEVQGSPTSTFSASDTAPASPNAGDIWYRSDTSQTLIYYDSTWVEIGHSANIANFLADADADTKIQLEESSDEDTIRFDTAGVERMTIDASGDIVINNDLTVDTSTLHVDSTTNRVGIGTASPSQSLTVYGKAIVGGDDDITPDALGNGHFMIDGAGYTGFATLDGTAMWVGHNSGSRSLNLATDETARVTISASGQVTMPYQTAFEVARTGGAYAVNQYTPFDYKYFDRGNNFSTSTRLFTAPISGLYFFYWTAIAGNVVSTYRYYLYVNGAKVGYTPDLHLRLPPYGTNYEFGTCVHTVELSANDTVGIYYGAGATDSYGSADYMRFGGHLIA